MELNTLNLKKSFSIAKENNLFARNEFILISGTLLFLFVAGVFSWNIGFVNDFREMGYISFIGLAYLLISNIIAGYFAISSISKDIDGKYIYFILKSVNRFEYIIGKFISIIWIIIKLNFLFAIIFAFFYKISVGKIDYSIFFIPVFQLIEAIIIGTFAILITFLIKSNIARIFFIITFYLIGHVTYPTKVMIDRGAINFGEIGNKIFIYFYNIFPNLERYNIRDVILYNTDLFQMLIISILYGILWIIVFILIAYLLFKKSNL